MKKGFTLIELLAVILILGVIALIAVPTVNKIIKNSRRGSWESSGNNMLKAAETYYQASQLRGKNLGTDLVIIKGGSIKIKTLDEVTINDIKTLIAEISIKGKTPQLSDILEFYVDANGKAGITFIVEDEFCADAKPGEEVKCGVCVYDINQEFTFSYNGTTGSDGSVQDFVTKCPGKYKMEVWGANGSPTGSIATATPGIGGYSIGTYTITRPVLLYAAIGGQSVNSSTGGYNGGGNVYNSGRTDCGGGATHIALRSGILSTLSSYKPDILIVAGGGGGGATNSKGGDGGGQNGAPGQASNGGTPPQGGSQTQGGANSMAAGGTNATNGSFGQGGIGSGNSGGAGGGGFYGGGGGGFYMGGGGGSGYINSILTSAYSTLPNGTGGVFISKPVSTGNGFVRITYLGE